MAEDLQQGLSRRQRQIVDAVYSLHSAGVEEVRRRVPSPPSYSAVRATLDVLARRGVLERQKQGRRYLYAPRVPHQKARRAVLGTVLEAYFGNSIQDAVSALISVGHTRLAPSDYEELISLISKAKNKKGKTNERSRPNRG
jgi:BlaI family transcriptional regulator, penicillinase repressor